MKIDDLWVGDDVLIKATGIKGKFQGKGTVSYTHLDVYKRQVQACYRGPRLYDTDKTKVVVKETIDWYKKYRDILNSDLIHLRRADGRDWDGIMHVNPNLKDKAFVLLYNPLNEDIKRKIKLPLYYTGLTTKAIVYESDKIFKLSTLNRDYSIDLEVTIPRAGYAWFVIR